MSMSCFGSSRIFKRLIENQSRNGLFVLKNENQLTKNRLGDGGGGGGGGEGLLIRRNRHTDSNANRDSGKITDLMRKAKDTVLLFEATKGPGGRIACGIGQAFGTGALTFGTGYGLISLHQLLKGEKAEGGENKPVYFDKEIAATEAAATDEKATNKRIRLTYFHMMSSLLVSSATALISFRLFRNKAVIIRLGQRPLFAIGLGVLTPLGMATVVHYLPKTTQNEATLVPFGLKELGNLFYAGSIGLLAAPLYLLGGQSIQRAVFITTGLFMGLHSLAQVAPQELFSNWGKPLGYAINGILISFILTLVLRRANRFYKPLFHFMMHGGLLIYAAHFLHISQSLNQAAKSNSYDPVTTSMALSMDLLSIYGRLAFLLPPHFQLSRDHLFIVPRSYFHNNSSSSPSSKSGKGNKPNHENSTSGSKENSFKPGGNDDNLM